MKKAFKLFALAFAVLVAAIALPLLTSAEKASAEKVELKGRGTLWAKGTGKAKLEGRLNFRGQARAAVLVVEDKAGDAKIDVKGYGKRIDEGNGKVRYVGFNGRAHIEGSHVLIDLQGKNIQLVARGAGTATLKGKGVYRVNGGEPKPWTERGETLELDDSAAGAEDSAN